MFSSEASRRGLLRSAATNVLAVALSTAVYFVLPLGVFDVVSTWAFVSAFALGIAVVATVIVRQVRRFRSGGVALTGVLTSLYLAVLFFAAVYTGISAHWPGSIASLSTKVDALYFALSITSTVGFGDVHAVSQSARLAVGIHLIFNLGFLGVAIAAVRTAASR
ncbi:ion channel [Saccharopolyspora gloriosae]|uniref:ion channel n=1 Tax=Saccharopolyspora gloriosae TaxID=455344 RepID=UPI001FB71D7F|nr:ion channel [Saccharopolyspora gloriosae]